MKFIIPLTEDSRNSFPQDCLVIEEGEKYYHISIDDSDRKVAVLKSDLIKCLKTLEYQGGD